MGLGLSNPTHLMFVAVVLLLVFGAKRLPEMGRSLGEGMRGFRETLSGQSHAELADPTHNIAAATAEAPRPVEAPAPVAEPVAGHAA